MMLRSAILALVLCQFAFCQKDSLEIYQKIADAVRQSTTQWVAGPYPVPPSHFKTGLKRQEENSFPLKSKAFGPTPNVNVPETFDAREQWPQCTTIRDIRDQGCCGSNYAVSAVSVMSDRWCINSPSKENFYFGEFDVLCKDSGRPRACDGGELRPVWDAWIKYGIGSGGPYGSNQGCHSYPFTTCNSTNFNQETPACTAPCQDRRYGRSVYEVNFSSIREEIYRYGPVQAAFDVYEDFRAYHGGVYRHIQGRSLGRHVVKIIGWGVETVEGKQVKYWLCANSWSRSWGDRGFFKIARGKNECNIEANVLAGLPDYTKHNSRSSGEY